MFEATASSLFFDYFRLPYRLRPPDAAGEGRALLAGALGSVSWANGGERRTLYWPTAADREIRRLPFDRHRLGEVPFFASVVPDDVSRGWLAELGSGWSSRSEVRDRQGRRVASIWESERGDLVLPFDPAEAMTACWSEAYRTAGGRKPTARALALARAAYYRTRPLVPRAVQIRLRQLIVPVQERAAFPRWPVETALHDLYDRLFELVAEVARRPVPWLSPWPAGRSWALVLTHDVETASGYEAIESLRAVEAEMGLRSSWNFVPERYQVDDAVVVELRRAGFEVGVHGARHDGRDLASLKTLRARMPVMRSSAERWGAVGFRSPATQRRWELMPLLGFEYDSSYPDTDPYEPQPGGCCTWLPFFNEDLVELPLTLPQDHTIFVLLGHQDESIWVEKSDHLRQSGGMALLNTHPDYQLDGLLVRAYSDFLRTVADDGRLWQALPREVNAWWRRRADSRIEQENGGWRVEGPAAGEAEIRFAEPR